MRYHTKIRWRDDNGIANPIDLIFLIIKKQIMINSYQRIDVSQARQWQQQGMLLLDIRDKVSFCQHHVRGSQSLYQQLAEFLAAHDPELPAMVLCYHGISSQTIAHYLFEQGIKQVYSIDGGFEAWQNQYPNDIVSLPHNN